MHGKTFLQSAKVPAASHTWRSICSSKEVVAKGISKLVCNGTDTSFFHDRWLLDKSLKEVMSHIPLEIDQAKVSELADCNGQWQWNKLSGLPVEVWEQLSLVHLDSLESDKTIWSAESNGCFSVKSAYGFSLDDPAAVFDWKKIWKLDASPRVKHFLWLVCHNRLLTKEACFTRHIVNSSLCPRCHGAAEDLLHLLRDCSFSKRIWSRWFHGVHLDHFCSLSLKDWILYNLRRSNVLVEGNISWPTCFGFVCWLIWSYRNKRVFVDNYVWPSNMHQLVIFAIRDYDRFKGAKRNATSLQLNFISWDPPPTGCAKLNVDGARSINGELSVGGLCRDAQGVCIFGFQKKIGRGAIICAELHAILLGLSLAWECGNRFENCFAEVTPSCS
ncbi:hypothetical protein REPUB_Repub08aG0106800 [Reevesia pubescens]